MGGTGTDRGIGIGTEAPVKALSFGSLFAGIGGFEIGLERAGWRPSWSVENDEFCSAVLKEHWPETPTYGDVRTVGVENLGAVDLVCGGPPCQPFSHAGKRGGKSDNRYLWPEMDRVIGELRPTWILMENVPGIISMALDDIPYDLERRGYTNRLNETKIDAFVIPACACGAFHQRKRLFILCWKRDREGAVPPSFDWPNPPVVEYWPPDWEDGIPRIVARVPNRVNRLKALGNAVVPPLIEVIANCITRVHYELGLPFVKDGAKK